jgi:drug/metabolite transporter (DMT)-like permease
MASRPAIPFAGFVMLLITAASWGLNWPVLKFVLGEWPPFLFRVLSGTTAVTLLVMVAWARGDSLAVPRGQFWRVAIASPAC